MRVFAWSSHLPKPWAVVALLFGASWLSACGEGSNSPVTGAAGGVTAQAGAAGAASALGGAAGSTGTTSGGAPRNNGGTGTTSGGANTASAGGAGAHSGGTSLGGTSLGGAGGNAAAGSSSGNLGGAGAGGAAPRLTGSIVPLYTYPSDASWSAIVTAKKAHPAVRVIAIVNPNSGPGDNVDATFTSGIAKLVAADIVPIGYVSTNYTKRGAAAVNADVDKWRAAYAAVAGIFFDEQSVQAGDEAFYRDASSHAKSTGFTLTVGNPGTGVPDSYLDTVDIMLNYESAGLPPLNGLGKYAAQREHFGIIPYAAAFDASYVKAAVDSIAYVYITGDDLPNPWDSLPSTFGDLLGALTP